MKDLIKLILAVLFACYAMVSCSSDDEDNQSNVELPVKVENIAAKWDVSKSDNQYIFFEFTENNKYIVIENSTVKSTTNDKIYHTGTYEIVGEKEIRLSGFGVITIVSLGKGNFSFSLKLNSTSEQPISFTANKTTEIATSSRTLLLCKTWQTITSYGSINVTFTKSGTYFVENNEDGEQSFESVTWRWNNSSETEIYYERDDDDPEDQNGVVKIVELTETRLIISEILDGEDFIREFSIFL